MLIFFGFCAVVIGIYAWHDIQMKKIEKELRKKK